MNNSQLESCMFLALRSIQLCPFQNTTPRSAVKALLNENTLQINQLTDQILITENPTRYTNLYTRLKCWLYDTSLHHPSL